jgi:hypothetical protein
VGEGFESKVFARGFNFPMVVRLSWRALKVIAKVGPSGLTHAISSLKEGSPEQKGESKNNGDSTYSLIEGLLYCIPIGGKKCYDQL